MLMSTDPGDLVLDPTCGSGTTAYVAEQWGRRWITIDTSRVALALARQRLMGARFPYYLLADSTEGARKEGELTGAAAAARSRPTNDIRQGFVYERVQHITLKSIANNPDIDEGMTASEIDAAIKRHADFELLYDKPYEDKKKVRVAGPFTVESLSPHRSLAFARRRRPESLAESEAAQDADAPTSSRRSSTTCARPASRTAGGRSGSSSTLVEPYAGDVHPGRRRRARTPTADAPQRVGIAIGPQYGTVSPPFIKDAAREAIDAEDVDLLCVLGFAFDPQVIGVTEDDVRRRLRRGLRHVAGERTLGPRPGAARADERRPAHGRGAQEDRRRQPLHRLRRARHRCSRDRRRRARRRAPRRRRLRPDDRRGAQQRAPTRSRCG